MLSLLSRGRMEYALTAEGFTLAYNPLLHANLLATGSLAGYEPVLQETIRHWTKPGMIAYDIGANVGVFSLLFYAMARPGNGRVFAFEPEPNNIACFERTLARNDCPGIILCRQAVSDAPGTAAFDRRGGAFSGRLVGRTQGYSATLNIAQVETISVDVCVFERGLPPPDIIKIDVEGNEGLVLEGMRGVLEKYHPIIICELHTHLGDDGARIREVLLQYGYEISALDACHIFCRYRDPGSPMPGDRRD